MPELDFNLIDLVLSKALLSNSSRAHSHESGTARNSLDDFDAQSEDNDSEVDFISLNSLLIETKSVLPITKSHFKTGSDVLYFPKNDETPTELPKKLKDVMRFNIHKLAPRVVRDAILSVGFTPTILLKTNWVGFWGKHWTPDRFAKLKTFQKANHFPFSFQVGRKDRMYQNLSAMKTKHGKEINFLPLTFILPLEYSRLSAQFIQNTSWSWIIKPPASARGLGIKVVTKLAKVPTNKPLVISRYINNPLLINGRKFDLRLYVLVTSFNPLRIYIHKNGVVRFAAQP